MNLMPFDSRVLARQLALLLHFIADSAEKRAIAAWPDDRPAATADMKHLAPPAFPARLGDESVRAYNAALRAWLASLRRTLRQNPRGASALALAAAADGGIDADASGLDAEPAEAPHDPQQLLYMHEAATLLAFYCANLLGGA